MAEPIEHLSDVRFIRDEGLGSPEKRERALTAAIAEIDKLVV
ncbi:TPA: hypothetical protein AB5A57_002388 [Vibrio cholerae]